MPTHPYFLHDTSAIDRFSTLYRHASSLQLRVDFVQHIDSLDLSTIRSTQATAWLLRKLDSLYCREISLSHFLVENLLLLFFLILFQLLFSQITVREDANIDRVTNLVETTPIHV